MVTFYTPNRKLQMISARVMQNRNKDCVRYANNNYNICQTRHQDDKKGNGGPLNNGLVNEMFNHILISSSEFVRPVYM